MSVRSQQRGMTLIGFVVVLAVLGFFAFTAMRLFPVYSEYYSVTQAMKAVQQEPGVSTWDVGRVRNALERHFIISYVDSVKPKDAKLIRQSNGNKLQITYEVRRPFAYNIDFVAKFDHSVELTRQRVV